MIVVFSWVAMPKPALRYGIVVLSRGRPARSTILTRNRVARLSTPGKTTIWQRSSAANATAVIPDWIRAEPDQRPPEEPAPPELAAGGTRLLRCRSEG